MSPQPDAVRASLADAAHPRPSGPTGPERPEPRPRPDRPSRPAPTCSSSGAASRGSGPRSRPRRTTLPRRGVWRPVGWPIAPRSQRRLRRAEPDPRARSGARLLAGGDRHSRAARSRELGRAPRRPSCAHGIDADFHLPGELTMALTDHQVPTVRRRSSSTAARHPRRPPRRREALGPGSTRRGTSRVFSTRRRPRRPRPARLGTRRRGRAARLGSTRTPRVPRSTARRTLSSCARSGSVRADRVVLGTGVFRGPLRRLAPGCSPSTTTCS